MLIPVPISKNDSRPLSLGHIKKRLPTPFIGQSPAGLVGSWPTIAYMWFITSSEVQRFWLLYFAASIGLVLSMAFGIIFGGVVLIAFDRLLEELF